jgi:hypothetical protein
MSAIAADLSPAERAERRAFLRRLRDLPPRSSADVVPIGRKPLGLRPVESDTDDAASERHPPGYRYDQDDNLLPSIQKGMDSLSAEARKAPMTAEDGFITLDVALKAALQGDDDLFDCIKKLRGQIIALETENARARALTAELKSKPHEVDFIVERLRIEGKGPPGAKGDRGRDGRDGPRGETGIRGERGEPGKAAPATTAWTVDTDNFTATPILSDGNTGAMLRLRPLFEAFADALNDADAAEEADAARASRDAVEREVQAQGR